MILSRICLLCVSCVMFFSGCGGTPVTRLYLLTPLPLTETQDQLARPLALGIGPIRLPTHLDRPEIVIEGNSHQIQLNEFDQWAEPLDENITSVLATNLAILLDTQQVSRYPWPPGTKVDYRITLDIDRFVAKSQGPVELVAHWAVRRSATGKPIIKKTLKLSEALAGDTIEEVVAAQSRILARLAQSIAEQMKHQLAK